MAAERQYHAVVLAGSPPDRPDPLAAWKGVPKKSLIPVAGKEMVRWVVEALWGSGRIATVVLAGLGPEDGLEFPAPVIYTPGGGSLLDNVLEGLDRVQELDPQAEKVVACSSDIPLITAEVVRYFVEECERTDHDLYYPIVEQQVMEAQFPGSGRTFVPLKEGRFAGGDIYMLRIQAARANEQLARRLLEERKNYLAQVRLIGFIPLCKFLLRRLDIPEAERIAGRALRVSGRAIISQHAEVGMDADKPHQLELIEQILLRRLEAHA